MPVLILAGVDLVALIVALAALLVLIALWVFIKPIAVALNHVPIPFVNVGDVLTSFLTSAMKSVIGLFDSIVHGFGHMLWALGVGMWHLLYQELSAIQGAQQSALQAIGLGHTNAASFGAALQATQTNIDQRLAAGAAAATAATSGAIAKALIPVGGEISSLTNQVDGLSAAVASGAANLPGIISAGAADVLNPALAGLNTVIDDVRSEAVSLFGTSEGAITVLQGQVLGIPAEITGTLDQVLPGSIAQALAGTGIVAIPGIIAQVQALEAEATTCLEPLCDTVTPNAKQLGDLGKLLQGVDGIFDALLLGALVTAAVEDPQGAAQAVVDVAGWIPELGTSLAHAAGAPV